MASALDKAAQTAGTASNSQTAQGSDADSTTASNSTSAGSSGSTTADEKKIAAALASLLQQFAASGYANLGQDGGAGSSLVATA